MAGRVPRGGADEGFGDLRPPRYNRTVSKRILVTGGAGYIGSNTTLQLLDAGMTSWWWITFRGAIARWSIRRGCASSMCSIPTGGPGDAGEPVRCGDPLRRLHCGGGIDAGSRKFTSKNNTAGSLSLLTRC